MENNSFGFKVGDFNCIVISDQNVGDYNVLFVQTGQHQVLIDPGLGHHVFPDSVYPGLLKHKLKGLGIYPTDINLIIYSHADVDHIGDRVDQAGNPAFPHARYVLLKE